MIYCNATQTLIANLHTGIQRVVRNICSQLWQSENIQIVYFKEGAFYTLDKSLNTIIDTVANRYLQAEGNPIDFKQGDVFFDLDSSWLKRYSPHTLYQQLKRRGCHICCLCHDIIPIQHPEYCHHNTVIRWYDFISAALVYVDYWICATQTTKNDLIALAEQFSVRSPHVTVLPFGADIPDKTTSIQDDKQQITSAYGQYFLSVGTIEPRKNHLLLLDAFDLWVEKGLTYNLIIVGRVGWKAQPILQRLKQHPQLGKRLFLIENANDTLLNTLYTHCHGLLQLSYQEGYGLPIVEALSYGKPVITTPIPVFHEVSQGINIKISSFSPEAIVTAITPLADAENWHAAKRHAQQFKTLSWQQAIQPYQSFFSDLVDHSTFNIPPSQLVYLSNNTKKFALSATSLCNAMEFITNVVVCCPDNQVNAFRNISEQLSVPLHIVAENTLLHDLPLPKDHATRNSLLRELLYQHELIDEMFLASDDDYIALEKIAMNVFWKSGVCHWYFHCDTHDHWLGGYPNRTSYDWLCLKTRNFLTKNSFDSKLYNSHMPQIYNKKMAQVIIQYCQGKGLDEWSTYANIAKSLAPDHFSDQYYCAAGWPQNFNVWMPPKALDNLLFLNAYPDDLKNHGTIDDVVLHWKKSMEAFFSNEYLHNQSNQPQIIINNDTVHISKTTCNLYTHIKIRIPILIGNRGNVKTIQWAIGDRTFSFSQENCPGFIYFSIPCMEKMFSNETEKKVCMTIFNSKEKIIDTKIFTICKLSV